MGLPSPGAVPGTKRPESSRRMGWFIEVASNVGAEFGAVYCRLPSPMPLHASPCMQLSATPRHCLPLDRLPVTGLP